MEKKEETKRKADKKTLIYIFPIALIILNFGAAIMCFVEKNYKKAVYWVAAAILNICVIF